MGYPFHDPLDVAPRPPFKADLKPGESVQLVSLAGFSPNDEMLGCFLPIFKTIDDVQKALLESKELIDDILLPAFTVSNEPLLDAYSKQNYLDNILRGGIPYMLPSKQGSTPLPHWQNGCERKKEYLKTNKTRRSGYRCRYCRADSG